MSQDPIFTQLDVFDAPEPPNLRPGLAERAVLFEVVRVTPGGRPVAPPQPPRAAQPRTRPPSSAMMLAIVGLVSGSTGAVASAAGIALGLVLGATLPQLAAPVTPDVHTVTATAPQVVALAAERLDTRVDSRVEVEQSDRALVELTDEAVVEASAAPTSREISIAEAMPHLAASTLPQPASAPVEPAPVAHSNDAVAALDADDEADSSESVWGAPPQFSSSPPAPPPPLRLAAAAPVTRAAPAKAQAPDDKVKLVDRLGLRKRK